MESVDKLREKSLDYAPNQDTRGGERGACGRKIEVERL